MRSKKKKSTGSLILHCLKYKKKIKRFDLFSIDEKLKYATLFWESYLHLCQMGCYYYPEFFVQTENMSQTD